MQARVATTTQGLPPRGPRPSSAGSARCRKQSRFGPEDWLQPYTEEKIIELAKGKVKNIVIICPGFSSDCIETLEEINLRAKEVFKKNGGKNFLMVPCLNDSKYHIDLLINLVEKYL